MNPLSSDPLRQAEQAIHDGKLQEARAQLIDYVKRDPNYDRAWWLLTFTLTDLNQQVDCLKRVLSLNPDHTQAREWLAKLKKTGSLPPLKPAVNPFVSGPETGSLENKPEPPVFSSRTEKPAPIATSMWPAPERRPAPSVEETLFPTGQKPSPAPVTPPPADTNPPVWTLPEDERPEPPRLEKSVPPGKQDQGPAPVKAKKPKKKSRVWAVLIILFLLCLVVGAGGIYWLSQNAASLGIEQALGTIQAQLITPTGTASPSPTVTSTPTVTPTATATETPGPTSEFSPTPTPIPANQIGPIVSLFAPSFTLTDAATGAPVSLEQFIGQPVVLFFWKTDCLPCVGEFTNLESLYASYQDSGLVLLAINVGEDAATIEAFTAERTITFPILLDPDKAVSQTYTVTTLPTHFFINASGRITYVAPGNMTPGELEWQIKSLVR